MRTYNQQAPTTAPLHFYICPLTSPSLILVSNISVTSVDTVKPGKQNSLMNSYSISTLSNKTKYTFLFLYTPNEIFTCPPFVEYPLSVLVDY